MSPRLRLGLAALPILLLGPILGSEQDLGIAFSVAPFLELPLMLLAGVLAWRWPARRLIQGVFVLGIVYYGLLASVRAPWQVYPVQVLSAASVAVTSGSAITFFQDFLPAQPGSATNLYSNAQRIGSTSGYLVLGWLTEAAGTRGVFAVCAVGAAIASGILLAHGARRRLAVEPAAPGPG